MATTAASNTTNAPPRATPAAATAATTAATTTPQTAPAATREAAYSAPDKLETAARASASQTSTSQTSTSQATAPANTEPATASPTEPAVPAQTVYYEEELPADFWHRESAPVDASDSPPEAGYVEAASDRQHAHSANPASLQEDPRFVALTQLFPGKIIDWQLPDTKKDLADSPDTAADLPASDITEDETDDALD